MHRVRVKANHLVYIAPSWSGSQISVDCKQNLFSLDYDTGGRFLLKRDFLFITLIFPSTITFSMFEIKKIGIFGNAWPSGMLKWKVF